MSTPRTVIVLILVAMAGLLTGCGSGKSTASTTHLSAAAQKEAAADAVIRGWANALRRGNVTAAAHYFAHPSIFANGAGSGGLATFVIHSERQAEAINESLSCGAKITTITQHKKYITAAFVLVNRAGPGADCGTGVGAPAATDFVIKNGKIVDWIRAPVGNAAPKIPALPANSAPSSPV